MLANVTVPSSHCKKHYLKNVQATSTCTTLTQKHTKPSDSRHQ